MKKFIWITVAFCLVLTVLVACSKNEEPVAETQAQTSAEKSETTKIVDKYDKYRNDGQNTEPSGTTESSGTTETTGTDTGVTNPPKFSESGYGDEYEWENGTDVSN